ncbi:hypothetical protein Tco_0365640, partial [Tanacetum coccineum]
FPLFATGISLGPVFLLGLSAFAMMMMIQRKVLEFKTSRGRHGNNEMSDPIGGLDTKISGGVVDLTSDEDPTDEDGDIGKITVVTLVEEQMSPWKREGAGMDHKKPGFELRRSTMEENGSYGSKSRLLASYAYNNNSGASRLGLRYEVGESSSAPTARPTRGFRANYGFVAILEDKIRRDPERDVGYGITDTWDEMLEGMPGAPTTDDIELGRRMTEFATMVREAIISREAWGRSMDAIDTAPSEVRALRTIVLAQQTEIAALRVADRARQAQHMETLRLISILQIQVTTL